MKKTQSIQIEDLGVQELPDELDILVSKKIKEAEKDLEDCRLQIRWKQRQINLVKEAARMMGIPYETYAKQVLYRQAVEDIMRGQSLAK